MAEYIEREKAFNAVLKLIPKVDDDGYCWVIRGDAATAIDSIPAADVRPVVRARWETAMLDHERMGCRPTAHYCSECHQITWFRTFFCPNCGADMREES